MLTGCSDPPAKARPVAPAKTPPTKAVAAERLEELLRAEGAAADAEEYYALAATLRAQVEARPDDADTWTSFGRALCRAALTVGRLHEDDDRALAAADEGISAFEKAISR